MKKIFTLAALTISLNCFSQVNEGMPSLLDVVNNFFTIYTQPDASQAVVLFQKRPQGWFVAEYDFKSASINKKASIFWDKSTSSYRPLTYEENTQKDTATINELVRTYISNRIDYTEQYYFDRNIYFGYDGWNTDVINYAKSQVTLSDTVLESLARAYSNLAAAYFYPQQANWASPDSDTSLSNLKDNEPISSFRVQKFMENEQKAIETYSKLASINPGYQTLIGNAGLKLANEKMFAYSTLLFIGHSKEGASFLPGIHVPDSLLNIARAMLAQVKPNSIFFTLGDNVTYPLLYLQYQGVRKDVIIIDLSLIGLKRVIAYYDRTYNHSLFNVDSTIYMNEKLNYALFDDGFGENKELRLDSFLQALYHSPDIKSIARPGREDYLPADDGTYKYFTKNTYIAVNKASAAKLFPGKKLYDKAYVPVIANYLVISEIMQFEIMQKNFGHRHIYFSEAPYDETYLKYAMRYGDVFEFTPEIH